MRLSVAAGAVALALAAAGGAQDGAVFRAEAGLVEVYATVLDSRGRYVDDLPRSAFTILDNGEPQHVVAFENTATTVSCAILLDTTGSMADALPKVRRAIFGLVDRFRAGDQIAVYGFTTALQALQTFTTDKLAAKRAVAQTRAEGGTALFDAIARAATEISGTSGKKAMVVFTDGADNASMLNATRAAERAKKVGMPVYTAAQGEALKVPLLMNQLRELARRTGGDSYSIREWKDAAEIFDGIAKHLQHTYYVAYTAPAGGDRTWRTIQIRLNQHTGLKVRAKEGYRPN
jgi:Ca-activated chloride channel homolog